MRLRILTTWLAALLCVFSASAHASNPFSAVYSTENDNIFWFVLTSDIHIGAKDGDGEENLQWLLTEGRQVIDPSFIVAAGDLTDSTDWSDSGYPDGPHDSEWITYRGIVDASGVTADLYYDLPGNHDHFGDRRFEHYLAYSLQGSTTGQTQVSWTRTFDFGTYHFLGVNTCGNDGADFSPLPPNYGDNAGLDDDELRFIEEDLEAHREANLSMVFGHHLIFKREVVYEDFIPGDLERPTMTALDYGADEFVSLLDRYSVALYGYGHTHTPVEQFLVKGMRTGVIYLNTASLAKSEEGHYRIVAVDNNGVSTVSMDAKTWPAVIITAPLDRNLGMAADPYTAGAADLTGSSTPIRALVFDRNPVQRVEYTMYKIATNVGSFVEGAVSGVVVEVVDEERAWNPMTQVSAGHPLYPYLWEADCPNPPGGGDYTVEVRATGSSTRSDRVPTAFPEEPVSGAGCFIRAASGRGEGHSFAEYLVYGPPSMILLWLLSCARGARTCPGGRSRIRTVRHSAPLGLPDDGMGIGRPLRREVTTRGRRLQRRIDHLPALWLILFSATFLASCAPTRTQIQTGKALSGREQVLEAVSSCEVTGPLLSRSGVAATALSSGNIDLKKPLKGLDPEGHHGGAPFRQALRDGTIVEGLFFPLGGDPSVPRPLLIASFGFLQDRWGSEAAKFHELYLSDPAERIPSHVLILDHPTAGSFLANNGFLSLGSYDDARMWIEIAQRLRQEIHPSGIHLLGVSMSGQTVIHALVEDQRLGLGLFQSGIVLSVAPDFRRAPGKQLARLKTPPGIPNPWKSDATASAGNPAVDLIQGWGIEVLVSQQFLPSYRRVNPGGRSLDLAAEEIPVFLRKATEDRILFLQQHPSPNWDREHFSLADLDSFMDSTRVAGILGRVRTPLVLVSARDDPAVERQMFEEVAAAAAGNPWIVAYETEQGGHFGFDVVYGKGFVRKIIELALNPQVLSNWNTVPPAPATSH